MTRPSVQRKKAKFRVGQVVAIRNRYADAGSYYVVRRVEVRHGEGFNYQLSSGFLCVEFAMRPLTKREVGR